MIQIADDESRERIALADLMAAMEDRVIGALIFVFAIPNVMPLPPGSSAILGAPLLFLTAQLTLGRRAWLPRSITQRSIDRVQFAVMIRRVAPLLARAERLLRPRLALLVRPPAENAVGVICFVLAAILFLPIPMGNIPPAAAICIFALAILERDGIWVIVGVAAAAAAIAVVWGVVFALIESGLYVLARVFH